jgi:hypothetical protein
LISCTTPATTSPIVGAAHAGHFEAGRRRARAVDGIDDEDELRVRGALQAAVFRIGGPGGQFLTHVLHKQVLGQLVDAEGDVTADGDARVLACGMLAERGQDDLAEASAQVYDAFGSVVHRAPILPCYTRDADRWPSRGQTPGHTP